VKSYGDYVLFTWRIMRAGANLGEPKFHLDGRAFNEPWGRPQNDGPALRALYNIRLAEWLLSQGDSSTLQRAIARDGGALITSDLDYIAAHWSDASYELWEEEKSYHFDTRYKQYQALAEGAVLARKMGNEAAAQRYEEGAARLKWALEGHWDGNR